MTLFFLAVAFGGPITPLKHLGWAAPPFLSPNTTDKVTIQTLQTSPNQVSFTALGGGQFDPPLILVDSAGAGGAMGALLP